MFGNSRAVSSNQNGIHEALETVVRRHLHCLWQAPLADHDRRAFEQARDWIEAQGAQRPLWLDSGCGTGRSTVTLARQHPEVLVLGLDQSASRLERGRGRFSPLPDNALLLRTDCAGFWRLAQAAGWQLDRHYLLYPNPWPKSVHLKRRWHGHPVFPHLLALGGTLLLRSNWALYLQEMAAALALAGYPASVEGIDIIDDGPAMGLLTDFEEKYAHSGHPLWQLVAELGARAEPK